MGRGEKGGHGVRVDGQRRPPPVLVQLADRLGLAEHPGRRHHYVDAPEPLHRGLDRRPLGSPISDVHRYAQPGRAIEGVHDCLVSVEPDHRAPL